MLRILAALTTVGGTVGLRATCHDRTEDTQPYRADDRSGHVGG